MTDAENCVMDMILSNRRMQNQAHVRVVIQGPWGCALAKCADSIFFVRLVILGRMAKTLAGCCGVVFPCGRMTSSGMCCEWGNNLADKVVTVPSKPYKVEWFQHQLAARTSTCPLQISYHTLVLMSLLVVSQSKLNASSCATYEKVNTSILRRPSTKIKTFFGQCAHSHPTLSRIRLCDILFMCFAHAMSWWSVKWSLQACSFLGLLNMHVEKYARHHPNRRDTHQKKHNGKKYMNCGQGLGWWYRLEMSRTKNTNFKYGGLSNFKWNFPRAPKLQNALLQAWQAYEFPREPPRETPKQLNLQSFLNRK